MSSKTRRGKTIPTPPIAGINRQFWFNRDEKPFFFSNWNSSLNKLIWFGSPVWFKYLQTFLLVFRWLNMWLLQNWKMYCRGVWANYWWRLRILNIITLIYYWITKYNLHKINFATYSSIHISAFSLTSYHTRFKFLYYFFMLHFMFILLYSSYIHVHNNVHLKNCSTKNNYEANACITCII